MKTLLGLLILASGVSFAETWELAKGSSTYQVRHLVKKVESESKDVKGKMNCEANDCEFLLATPVKSYTSSDSNRDLNMQNTVEAHKFPMAIARGHFPKSKLSEQKWVLPAEIEFHGVKKTYDLQMQKKSESEYTVSFQLKLDQHNIVRPSLFAVKINDEVPMTFDLVWSKK